jgi:hypothetical protein
VRRQLPATIALIAVAALVALGGPVQSGPTEAKAASCTVASPSFFGGVLAIQGGTCADVPEVAEDFTVYCASGAARLTYRTDGVPDDTPLGPACSAPTRIRVSGFSGPNVIDLSLVTAAAGFTSVTGPNELSGGSAADRIFGSAFPDTIAASAGDDRLFLRDGRKDSADCGAGSDNAQADAASIDALSGCEVADRLPEAAKPKKCKKKKSKRAATAKKKCRKKSK